MPNRMSAPRNRGQPRRFFVIQFACSTCAQKLSVKNEFAGRHACCPTCKQPMVVPSANETITVAPAGLIDGMPSSVAQAGLDGGVTLDEIVAARNEQKPVRELLAGKGKK